MALRDLVTDGDVAKAGRPSSWSSGRARAITGQSLPVNAGEPMR